MIDYYYWLVNDFLHAVDRNTMMFGLEARTPFLDNKVYEVAKSLPTYAKINKETTKVALRKAASKVIPNEAYKKKKHVPNAIAVIATCFAKMNKESIDFRELINDLELEKKEKKGAGFSKKKVSKEKEKSKK